jgi:hypothetical protein
MYAGSLLHTRLARALALGISVVTLGLSACEANVTSPSPSPSPGPVAEPPARPGDVLPFPEPDRCAETARPPRPRPEGRGQCRI